MFASLGDSMFDEQLNCVSMKENGDLYHWPDITYFNVCPFNF